MLSSHSSIIGLFLGLAGGSLGPCHALRVRITEDTGIVADEHHAEESPGDLAQPPEASENEKIIITRIVKKVCTCLNENNTFMSDGIRVNY